MESLERKGHHYVCWKQDVLYMQMLEATFLFEGVPGEIVFYYRGTN
jgi:hypothetical protein